MQLKTKNFTRLLEHQRRKISEMAQGGELKIFSKERMQLQFSDTGGNPPGYDSFIREQLRSIAGAFGPKK